MLRDVYTFIGEYDNFGLTGFVTQLSPAPIFGMVSGIPSAWYLDRA